MLTRVSRHFVETFVKCYAGFGAMQTCVHLADLEILQNENVLFKIGYVTAEQETSKFAFLNFKANSQPT